MRAVTHATNVLSWQENLPSDEMPPEWMWSFDEELETWFEDVQVAREEKYGAARNRDPEAPNMEENVLDVARDLRRRR